MTPNPYCGNGPCRAGIARLQADLERARATNTALNRRAQAAESRVLTLENELQRDARDLVEASSAVDALVSGLQGQLAAAQERIRMLEAVAVWTKDTPPALPPVVPQAEEGDAPAPSASEDRIERAAAILARPLPATEPALTQEIHRRADEVEAVLAGERPAAADYCPKNPDHKHRDSGGMFFFSCRDCGWKDDDGSIPSV